jgi:hypothetical protein
MFLGVFAGSEVLSLGSARLCDRRATWPCRNVEDHSSQASRIIVAYRSLMAKAADSIDIKSFGRRPPWRLTRAGLAPRIEVRFKRAAEKRRSLLSCGNPAKPELPNQAVLQGIKQSLDTTLGWGEMARSA